MIFFPATVLLILTLSLNAWGQNLTSVIGVRQESEPLCPAVATCLRRLDKGKKCALLPVPQRALFPLIGTGFKLTQLRTGVWFFEDLAYNALILKSGSRLAVLDFPEAANEAGLPYIALAAKQVLDGETPTRIDMVYTHGHYDHIGGATKFHRWAKRRYPSASILIWGTIETRKIIFHSVSKRAPSPNIIVHSRGRTLELSADLKVKMSIMGGHAGEDLGLYIPPRGGEPGVFMLIDIVFPRWAPFRNLAITSNVFRYIQVHKEALRIDWKYFVGGHFRLGSRGDVRESLHFSEDLLAASRTSINSLTQANFSVAGLDNIFNPALPEFGNVWYGFLNVVRRLQIEGCIRIMIEKYGCRLGGLDIVIESQCFMGVEQVLLEE